MRYGWGAWFEGGALAGAALQGQLFGCVPDVRVGRVAVAVRRVLRPYGGCGVWFDGGVLRATGRARDGGRHLREVWWAFDRVRVSGGAWYDAG